MTYRLGFNRTAIVETIIADDHVDLEIPDSITTSAFSGSTYYNVTALSDSIFHNNSSDNYIYSVTFPSTITEVSEKAFDIYGPSAIVWKSDAKLPTNSFDNSEYRNSNFILYVNNKDIAPSNVKNLIVNGEADEITLLENKVFNCPKEFTAKKINFTHNYQMETPIDDCGGWETIALPFDVQTITHEEKGELVPFAAWTSTSDKKPFWLYNLSKKGFVKASEIKANTPYLISMPNNSQYSTPYNLSGKVTFSATNAIVRKTNDSIWNTSTYNGATFIPCYSFIEKSKDTYALNVNNDYFTYSGSDPKPGSVFLSNNRIIAPFEGRFYKSESNSRIITIDFTDEDVTGIENVLCANRAIVKIYSLSGQLVKESKTGTMDNALKGLPSGMYIVNGKKVIVK